MARPLKQGLDYFPFDVDFFHDEKIVAIAGEFNVKGEIVAIKLLCAIYRNGYYLQWNDLMKYKLLQQLPGISANLLEEIVIRLVRWGFFDNTLFESDGVLTSRGIQKRYFEASRRRKSTENLPYLLVNVCNNIVSVHNNAIHVDKNTLKKSKVNKTLSLSPSLQSGDREKRLLSDGPTKTERERFFEIFFFKNFTDPAAEVDKFISYYQSTGWQRDGHPITDRVALARMWDSKITARRFPADFMDFWKSVYYELSKVESAKNGLNLMYSGLKGVNVADNVLILSVTAGLKDYLESNTGHVRKLFFEHFPGHRLVYKIQKGY